MAQMFSEKIQDQLIDIQLIILDYLGKLDSSYGGVCFNEFLLVVKIHDKWKLPAHLDLTNSDAEPEKNFTKNVKPLKDQICYALDYYMAGGYEFAPDGDGPKFDVFIKVGNGLPAAVILNHKSKNMVQIEADGDWKEAKKMFDQLAKVLSKINL